MSRNAPGYHRRNRSSPFRRYQTQLVPGSSDPYKYIPLRGTSTPSPRLWWQPLTINIPSAYSKVAIQDSAKSSTTDASKLSSTEMETTTQVIPEESQASTLSEDDYFEATTLLPIEDDA